MPTNKEMQAEQRERLFQLLVVKARIGDAPSYDLDAFIAASKAKMDQEDISHIEKLVTEFVTKNKN